jgi:hypothetical protein
MENTADALRGQGGAERSDGFLACFCGAIIKIEAVIQTGLPAFLKLLIRRSEIYSNQLLLIPPDSEQPNTRQCPWRRL